MIYLDYGATSPMREEVTQAMLPFFSTEYGNPGSLHDLGYDSFDAIEQARHNVATALGTQNPREIIFTSSGTEANNLAIIGVARQYQARGKHIITTQAEHPSVLEACRYLQQEGYNLTYLPVDEYGMISLEQLEQAITPETILISIMAANNEVGTLQPLQQIAEIIGNKPILLHTDAVQYVGKIPFSLTEIPVDLLSLGSHKIYGPKGVGALFIRKGVRIKPLLYGGGQERGLRPSTLPTPLIVGFGKAISLSNQEVSTEFTRLTSLRNQCWQQIQQKIGHVTLNGHPRHRLPGNLNLSFQGIEGQAIMLELNREQIFVSSGSACSAGKHQASHVLMAMGKDEETAYQSLRITMGRQTTEQELETLITKLTSITHYFRTLF